MEWFTKNPSSLHKKAKGLADITYQVSDEDLKTVEPFNIALQFQVFRDDIAKK